MSQLPDDEDLQVDTTDHSDGLAAIADREIDPGVVGVIRDVNTCDR
jgi:hypothetical protein